MRESSGEARLPSSARSLRLVLQCREPRSIAYCEHIAFAFARDAGLRGVDVWFAAACASRLATHLVSRAAGGELELRVASRPRAALELVATDDGPPLDGFSTDLRAARDCAGELRVAWHAGTSSIVTARFWLRGHA